LFSNLLFMAWTGVDRVPITSYIFLPFQQSRNGTIIYNLRQGFAMPSTEGFSTFNPSGHGPRRSADPKSSLKLHFSSRCLSNYGVNGG
jgi:hypothetical protein